MSTIKNHFSFMSEWFDEKSATIRNFVLNIYPNDCSIEMIDLKKNKMFLRRTHCVEISLKDLFVGNSVRIFSRVLKIIDYADDHTRQYFKLNNYECSIAIFGPHRNDKKSELIQDFINHSFEIINMIMIHVDNDLKTMLSQYESTSRLSLSTMLDGPIIVFQLRSMNAVQKLLDVVGPDNREEALNNYPHSLRARYSNLDSNNLYVATHDTVEKLSEIFFPTNESKLKLRPFCLLDNTTLCIIKPHALKQGNMANILQMIEDNNFEISGMRMLLLSHAQAVHLLEVYQGVVNEYPGYVSHLISGKCLALEIKGKIGINTPNEFRNLAGPADVEIAKALRPNTIRAKFGLNNVENAVHVTDIPEDSTFEVEYMFRII